jgi:hypothetical protein
MAVGVLIFDWKVFVWLTTFKFDFILTTCCFDYVRPLPCMCGRKGMGQRVAILPIIGWEGRRVVGAVSGVF